MMLRAACLTVLLLVAPAAPAHDDIHPPPFDETADAMAEVDAALARAALSGRRLLVIMGGNWCHDSRGFARHMASPSIAALAATRYETVWVDVGFRHRNLRTARRFGLHALYGTPTVIIADAQGNALNGAEAHGWSNAYDRTTDELHAWLTRWADAPPERPGLVESTAAHAALLADIDAWEAEQAGWLNAAYAVMALWREQLGPERARAPAAETDAEAARFLSYEAAVDAWRGRVRAELRALRAAARDAVLADLAALSGGGPLTREIAAAYDASGRTPTLDWPASQPAFAWEGGQ